MARVSTTLSTLNLTNESIHSNSSIMRMKDYERERRLDERQKRILNRMKQEE